MRELREALAWAAEEERDVLIELLFRPRFNPLDYFQTPSPEDVRALCRDKQLHSIETRFCFLAADGLTVLKGQAQALCYRTLLLRSCRYLKVAHSEDFSTEALEAEFFLHVLRIGWKKLPPKERWRLSYNLHQSLIQAPETRHLGRWVQQRNLRLLLEGGSAIAISAVVRPLLLKQIARQIMFHTAQRQVAHELLRQGSTTVARLQGQVAMQMAGRGVALNMARYGAARSVLGVLGPAIWACFFAELGWRAIATNHARIIPALFLLAQIRLTQTETCEEHSQRLRQNRALSRTWLDPLSTAAS